MLRGSFTYSDWQWSQVSGVPDRTAFLGAGNFVGDQVLQGQALPSGSRQSVYINSKWSYNVNGLYQVSPDRPWAFNVGFNLNGRQGYPVPYYRKVFNLPGGVPYDNVMVTSTTDSVRLPNLHLLDMRVEKDIALGSMNLNLGVDVFNVTNESTVLQRQHRLGIGSSNYVTEILSPRIFRLGARLSFR